MLSRSQACGERGKIFSRGVWGCEQLVDDVASTPQTVEPRLTAFRLALAEILSFFASGSL